MLKLYLGQWVSVAGVYPALQCGVPACYLFVWMSFSTHNTFVPMCWEFGALLMELELCSWPISRSSFSPSHNLTAKQEWKREGNLIWPVLIDNVRPDMRIAWEEPFGPVIPVLRIKTVEEGIHHCNANNFALQVHIFCKKLLLQTCYTMFKGSPKYHHFSNVT